MCFEICFSSYKMRPIKKEDLKRILKWRNSDGIHNMMLTDHKISWKEHEDWFENIVIKQRRPMHFIVSYEEKDFGYIGYTDIDWDNKTCSPSAYIGDLQVAPVDAGVVLGYLSLFYIFEELGFEESVAIVLKENTKAYKLNRFLGYKRETISQKGFLKQGNDKDAFLLRMVRDDWKREKEKVEGFYE